MNYFLSFLFVAFGFCCFMLGFSFCYQGCKKWRIITIAADAPYLQQIQKIAFDRKADLWMVIRTHCDPEEQAKVSIKFKDGSETREIEFYAPTCEQAAKLVVERIGK